MWKLICHPQGHGDAFGCIVTGRQGLGSLGRTGASSQVHFIRTIIVQTLWESSRNHGRCYVHITQ